ncbi:MAG: AAA family ATPase, partial [Gammaproteobacteria bacterium]|nr:AAA family ATPase [Gammaproteobacteria bacterium]
MTYSVNIAEAYSSPRPRPQVAMSELNRQCILERISIEGFRSFRSLQDFELRNINILIGANGSGKSNFIDFIEWVGDTARIALGEQDTSVRKRNAWDDDDMLFFTGKEPALQTVFRLTTAGINYSLTMPQGRLEGATFSLDNKTFRFSERAGADASGGNGADVSVASTANGGADASMANSANPVDAQEAYGFFRLLADLKVYHFHHIRET